MFKYSCAELQVPKNFSIIGIPNKAPKIICLMATPPSSWVKVNIDGSFSSNSGCSGTGGVFRNTRGFTLGCLAFPIDSILTFVVEL